jgi:hypothetical protein
MTMLTALTTSTRRGALMTLMIGLLTAAGLMSGTAEARYYAGRHYYSSWNYHPQRTYYYTYYYYKPTPTYNSYNYHYCVYYTSQPRYVYYYNPVRRVYWGRYDMEAKGYSKLEEKDQKADLKDIPDSAFPKPGEMPEIPESKDGEKMLPIDPATLPNEKAPEDAPAK